MSGKQYIWPEFPTPRKRKEEEKLLAERKKEAQFRKITGQTRPVSPLRPPSRFALLATPATPSHPSRSGMRPLLLGSDTAASSGFDIDASVVASTVPAQDRGMLYRK